MPNWKKLIVSGSEANLNSLTVTTTGSFFDDLTISGSNSSLILKSDGNKFARLTHNGDGLVIDGSVQNQYISIGSPTWNWPNGVRVYGDLQQSGSAGSTATFEGPSQATVNLKTTSGNKNNYIVGTTTGDLSFRPDGTQSVVFKSGGKVGIGTATPNTALQVNQATTVPLLVHRPSNTDFDPHGIGFSTRNDAVNGGLGDVRSGIFSDYNGDLFLAASQSSITTNPLASSRLFIEGSNGNVGIGTTTPGARLDVNGPTLGNTSGDTALAASIKGGRQVIDFKNFRTANENDWNSATFRIQARIDSTVHQSIDFVNDNSYNEHIDIRTGNQVFNTRFNANGNVGIGTTTPGRKLEVAGDVGIDGYIYHNGDDSRIGFEGNDAIRMYTANSVRLQIDSNGNLGIGTTSPSTVGGTAKMTINVGTGTATPISIVNGTTDGMYIRRYDANGQYQIQTTVGAGNSGNLSFQSYGGNVGIGATSPNEKLQVAGNINAFAPSGINAGLFASTAGGSTTIAIRSSGVTHFNGGNVGIGTTTPSAKLEVYNSGSTVFEVNGSQGQLFSITDSLSGSLFSVSDISGTPLFEVESDSTVTLGDYNTNTLVVTGSLVGIGKGDPDYKLHVKDNQDSSVLSGIVVERSANTQKAYFNVVGGAANLIADTSIPIKLRHGSSTRLEINTSGNSTFSGNLSTTGDFAAEDNIYLTDNGTVRAKLLLNASDRDNVELRAESLGSTMKFFTVGTEALLLDASQNATFTGIVKPSSNGSKDLGGASNRWATVYTSNISTSTSSTFGGDIVLDDHVDSSPNLYFYNQANNFARLTFGTSDQLFFKIGTANKLILSPTSATFENDIYSGGNIRVQKNTPILELGTLNTSTGNSKLTFYSKNNGTANSFAVQYHKDTGIDRLEFIDGSGNPNIKFNNGGSAVFAGGGNFGGQVVTGTSLIVNGSSSNSSLTLGANTGNWVFTNVQASRDLILSDSDGTGTVLTINTAGNATFAGDVVVAGTITAQEFKSELVSASIVYQSGSSKFGDTTDDNHDFTGSVNIKAQSGAGGLTINRSATSYVNINNSSTVSEFNFSAPSGLRFYHGSDSSTPLFISSSGEVGVGTNTPDYKFEVQGVISSADSALQKATFANVGNDLVLTANATATNVTANLLFKSSGTSGAAVSEKMRIGPNGAIKFNAYGGGTNSGTLAKSLGVDSSGNVIEFSGGGGGTVSTITDGADTRIAFFNSANALEGTPNFTWNDTALHIKGNSDTSDDFLIIEDLDPTVGSSTPRIQFRSGSTALGSIRGHDTRGLQLGGGTNSQDLTITAAGDVGIGTTDPSSNLDVYDTGISTFTLGYGGGNGNGSAINFSLVGNAGVSQPITTQIKAIDDGNFRQNLSFLTKTSQSGASALTERMRLTGAGNVGIGTTSPGGKLDVHGDLHVGSGGNKARLKSDGTHTYLDSIPNSGAIVFRNAGSVEKMRLLANGNLGIGTTAAYAKTEIQGAFIANATPVVIKKSKLLNLALQTSGFYGGFAEFWMGRYANVSNHAKSVLTIALNDGLYGTNATNADTDVMTLRADGSVGIGTNAPAVKFQVHRTDNTVTQAGITNSGTGATALYFDASNGDMAGSDYMQIGQNNDLSGQIQMEPNAGSFNIKTGTGGAVRFTVNQTGNIGIGEPNIDARLHISAHASNGLSNIKLESPGASKWAFGIPANKTYFALDDTNDDLSTPKVVVAKTTGNVGIGTPTPQAPLHIYRSLNGGIGGEIKLDNNNGAVANKTRLLFSDSAGGTFAGDRGAIVCETEASPYKGQLQFQTGVGTLTTRMTITGEGLIGIGTTSPDYKLQIATPGITAGSTYSWPFDLTRAGISATRGFSIGVGTAGGNVALGNHNGDMSFGHTFGTDSNGHPQFYETMRIQHVDQAVGRVGIGTTNPSTPLHVIGIAQIKTGSETAFYEGNGVRVFGTQNYRFRNTGGGVRAIIDVNSTGVTAGNLSLYNASNVVTSYINNAGNSYFNGGNVGIGTASPTTKLTIAATGAPDIRIQDLDGTNQYGDRGHNNGETTYVSRNNTAFGSHAFYSNNGTATQLRVKFDETFGAGSSLITADGSAGNNYGGFLGTSDATTVQMWASNGGLIYIGSRTNHDVNFTINNAIKMTLDTNGRVGIGTTNPTVPLEVVGAVKAVAVSLTQTASGTGVQHPLYSLHTSNNTIRISQYGQSHANSPAVNQIGVSNSEQHLHLVTDSNANVLAGTSTKGIFLRSGGNVGIGTRAPSYKFDVAGDIQNNGVLRRGGNVFIKSTGSETMIGPAGSGIISFHNSSTMTAGDETVRIDASGNLLLNNTSAGARLDIREDSGYAIRAEDASGHYFRVNTGGDTEIRGNVTVAGTLTAQEFHTELVSASIIYESGSTKFGDTSDDDHDFTGSLNVKGTVNAISSGLSNFERLKINNLQSWSAQDLGSASSGSVAFRINGRSGATNDFIVSSAHGTANYTMQVVGNATTSGELHINPFGGNVGVLTNSPLAALSVGAGSLADGNVPVQISTSGGSSQKWFGVNKNGSYGLLMGYLNGGSIGDGGAGAYIRNVTEDPLYFMVSNSDLAMTILANKNVGIGIANPTTQLHLKRTTGDVRGIMVETSVATSYAEIQVKAASEFRIGTGGSSTAPNGQFYVYDATAGKHRFDINSAGNVGIGTISPVSLSANTVSLTINSSRNDLTGGIFLRANGTTKSQFYWDSTGLVTEVQSGAARWFTGNTERMRIVSGGNVGIGNTAPVEKLQVSGNIFAQTNIIDADASNANPNLLTQACIKMSLESDIYVNATRVIINEYEARFTNDGTGGSTIRLDAQSSMTAGQAHTFSIYYKDLIGTLSIDIGDIGVTGTHTSATGTSASPTSGRIYGTAIKPTTAPHNGYNFIDINFSTNGAVTLLHPKVEEGSVPTKFVTTTEAESDPQTLTTNNIITTGDINLGGNSLLGFEHQEVDSTTANIASVDKVKFSAAFFDYVIKKGTNIRAGVVYACHDGTNVEFSDVSTVDLGDTSTVTFSAIADSTKMILRATTTSNDWHIKTLVRAL